MCFSCCSRRRRAPPSCVTPIAISPIEQSAFNGNVATFTSDDVPAQPVSNYTATVDWGDGSPIGIGVITQPGGAGTAFFVSASHTYAEDGNYAMTVTVVDTFAGTSVPATIVILVHEALLSMTGAILTATEGSVFNGTTATFQDPPNIDPPSNYVATIDWGDGTTTAATITQPGGPGAAYALSGTHTYADEGSFTVTTTAAEATDPTFTISIGSPMTVAEADNLAGVPISFSARQSVPFNGPVATFTDTNVLNVPADFVATINWGDGTPVTAGTITGGGASYTVSGSHTYGSLGTFNVTVTLADDPPGTATASITGTAMVLPASGIPTLSEWGLWLLSALTVVTGLGILRRRRRHSG